MKARPASLHALSFVVLLCAVFDANAFYNPTVGKWASRDPIGENGGVNLFAFVRNRPTIAVDVVGLVEFPRLPGIPDFPWPDPRLRPPKPPIRWPKFPRIDLPEDPLSCSIRIKNSVWNRYGWDSEGNPRPDHRPGDNSFHYGHCVAHCRIQRECLGGRCTSWAGGVAKEIWDEVKEHLGGGGVGFDGGDMDANREGRKRGREMKHLSCDVACHGTEG